MINKVKDYIRSVYAGKLAISLLHCVECKLVPVFVSDEKAVKKYYCKRTGKQLNLNNPKTFSEKINCYKLNVKMPLMQQCADKVAVREYVKDNGYGDCLNELYGVYYKVGDIDIDKLPDKFILKAAHGSHMSLIVKDKNVVNWRREKLMMKTWLLQDIAWSGREWIYKDMPKRIIAEKYLEDKYGGLRDYKFYCFNGTPKYVDVDVDRYSNHYRNFYDLDWNFIPMESIVPNNPNANIDPPVNLQYMIEMATKLSSPFPFVRVDLYEVEDKVYFGELTFFQDGGNPGYSEYYDKLIGEYWR